MSFMSRSRSDDTISLRSGVDKVRGVALALVAAPAGFCGVLLFAPLISFLPKTSGVELVNLSLAMFGRPTFVAFASDFEIR